MSLQNSHFSRFTSTVSLLLRGRFGSLHAKFGLILAVAVMALIGVACGSGEASTLDPAGPVAETQFNLLLYVFWIAVAVFIIVEGLIIFVIFKYRRRNDAIPEQTHGNGRLELLWTIIPAIIIVAIAIPTVRGIWDLARPECPNGTMQVEAIGHQWWFEFRYPTERVITANELVVPTGKCVELHLQSQDVIHSFWVPRLFGKRDMVPNQTNLLTFTADEADEYLGICAELCGIAHAKMQFRVIALEQADYDDWVNDWFVAPVRPEAGSSVAAGQLLFNQHCATCHTVNSYQVGGYNAEVDAQERRWASFISDPTPRGGSNLPAGSPLVSAPNLTQFATRTTLGAGALDLNRDTLFDWIKNPSVARDGSEVKPGTRMQNHAAVYVGQLSDSEVTQYQNRRTENFAVDVDAGLSDSEINQLVDYLFSLTPGDAATAQTTSEGSGT